MSAAFDPTSGGPRSRSAGTRRRDLARLRAAVILLLLVSGGAFAVWLTLRADERAAPAQRGCSSSAAPVAGIRIRVLNATTRSGLAASVAAQLRGRGYTVTGVGNDVRSVLGAGELRYGPKGAVPARTVLSLVPGAARRPDRRGGVGIDLVLGNRFTRLAPAKGLPTPSSSRCPAPATPTPSPPRA